MLGLGTVLHCTVQDSVTLVVQESARACLRIKSVHGREKFPMRQTKRFISHPPSPPPTAIHKRGINGWGAKHNTTSHVSHGVELRLLDGKKFGGVAHSHFLHLHSALLISPSQKESERSVLYGIRDQTGKTIQSSRPSPSPLRHTRQFRG